MARLFDTGIFSVNDTDGSVGAGWKLYFYITGTSTLKNTYTTSALSVANANPVVADANGRWGPIWLNDGDYKVILKDADDVTIVTRDPADSDGAIDLRGFTIELYTNIATTTIPAIVDSFYLQGYTAVGDGGGAQYKRAVSEPSHAGKAQSADSAWWELVLPGTLRPQMFSGTANATAINSAIVYADAKGGIPVHLSGGTWTVNATVVLYSGVPLLLDPNAVLSRGSGFVGTMVRSKDFSTYTGTTDATAAYPRHISLKGGRIDGRYMNDASTAYVETSGGNGIEIYAHKIDLETTVQNIPGIGVWLESSTGNGDLDLDYPRFGRVNLNIQATKYEGLIYKGPADEIIDRVFCTNAGARIASEQDTGLVSSPTYGGTNGGYTDGVVFDTGCEIPGVVHSWGHYTGRGIVINDGRFNVTGMMMSETCRYGACRILGGYGFIAMLELHRSGGYNSDTQPMLEFDAPEDDGQMWDIRGKIYHKNSSETTARNLVELDSAGRSLKANFDLVGDNVPGHGVVINGSYNFLDLHVTARKINGTAADTNTASAIFRTATFSTRSYRMSGYFVDCDVVFRSSGTPEAEVLDFTYDLNTSQVPFAGDVRSNAGQDWRFFGTVNGTFSGSKNKGASSAWDSNSTTEQTVTIAHGLMAAPAFGRYQLGGILDTGTGMSAAVIQYMYISNVDATNITAKVKLSTANGSDTAPRLLWNAEV